ncbi:MAG: electron transport complex subunit RsxC [Actinomycetota bacterium]|nr:electron transport complex subunit RsxC [Actinomycetota bacterium]
MPTFAGGIHPPDKKELSQSKPITYVKAPKRVVIPLRQHLGAPAKATVAVGDDVKAGAVLGTAEGFVSAPVHSSVSGKVIATGEFPMALGRPIESVVIENDGKDEWVPLQDDPSYMELPPEVIREKIKAAGIVGMGGATFPTAVKLSPPKEKKVDVVILNGAECEPYLTADHRLMIEKPKEVIEGLRIIMRALGVNKGFVGIEDNKPDAIEAMQNAARPWPEIRVCALQVKYPQGAEKMLIKAVSGREVPPRALPMDVGAVVQNIGTTYAIYEAVRFGKPLVERVVTVSGEAIKEPKNLLVKIGTLVTDLIEECGGLLNGAAKVISGGPMMGFAISSLDVPVTKGTSGILALPGSGLFHADTFGPCIRCSRCVDVCPMALNPGLLSVFAEKGHFEDAKAHNLFDCFECGSCAFVCPSKRPIVQLVRFAKSMVKP